MEIITERLVLRHWRESDAESLFFYASDPAVGPIAGWPPHQSIAESLAVIQNVFSGAECWAICLKGTDTPVGCIELKLAGNSDMTDREDECELGYWIGKPFWGMGYMPEAARALLKRAFTELNMQRVWCGWYEGNLRSKRVQEKVGFVYCRTVENLPVPLLGVTRTGHASELTRARWNALSTE